MRKIIIISLILCLLVPLATAEVWIPKPVTSNYDSINVSYNQSVPVIYRNGVKKTLVDKVLNKIPPELFYGVSYLDFTYEPFISNTWGLYYPSNNYIEINRGTYSNENHIYCTILHELGHSVDYSDGRWSADKESFADDFARVHGDCDFGDY